MCRFGKGGFVWRLNFNWKRFRDFKPYIFSYIHKYVCDCNTLYKRAEILNIV